MNSFKKSVNIFEELFTCLKAKNRKSKKNCKNHKTLTLILESVDTIAIIGSTTTSVKLLATGFGLIVVPMSAGISCTLSLGNKVLHKILLNKYI